MIEENAIAYYRGLTRALGGQFTEQESIVWFSTGRRSLMRFNGVLRTHVDSGSFAAVSDPVLNAFRLHNLPFFWVVFASGAAPGLGAYLLSQNPTLVAPGMPAMTRGLSDLPVFRLPDRVEIVEVRSEEDQADWLSVHMRGFDEPEDARVDFQQFLGCSLTEAKSTWRHYLARWQGEPCAISTLLCARQAAGIYHVTTLPGFRGKGLGKALTLTAMQAAQQAGYSTAILFATPDGFPIYQKLGFETAQTVDLYGWNRS